MSDQNAPIIVWFRQDLRLSDNPALKEATEKGTILPLYILDDENAGEWKIGGAGRVWLHHALNALNDKLDGNLVLKCGKADEVLPELIKETNAKAVYWNRCYEPWRVKRDKAIKETLDVECKSFNASLLWEPWDISKNDGTPYRVFTPYYRKGCLKAKAPRKPYDAPHKMDLTTTEGLSLDDLGLLPKNLDWHIDLADQWDISQDGAKQQLYKFLDNGLKNYKEGRNIPSGKNFSMLSPYLHWGLISPNRVWYLAEERGVAEGVEKDLDHFHSELGWREFSYSLLYYFPDLPSENLQSKFDNFPWEENADYLKAWQNGQTGYPIVDAAMRELYATGFMHNRTRMVVGSFLVKHLLQHWRHGEDWFWDCLVDADLASNSASWQWVAGTGADAAPYFRVFNPILQGKRFDENGDYVRKWIPELAKLPNEFIHEPWEAGPLILQGADIELGVTYPKPIVDHSQARDYALASYDHIKGT